MLNNIVDNLEQCWQQNIVQCCLHQARTGCSFFAVYIQMQNILIWICLEGGGGGGEEGEHNFN